MMVTLTLLAACDGSKIDYEGTGPMDEYFPYDGARSATYYYGGEVASDTGQAGVGYNLDVEKIEPVEDIGGVEVVTFTYSRNYGEGVVELLGQIKWASDGDGIRIYGFAEGTDDFTMFDSPVVMAENYMHVNDEIVTVTNDYTFTSTYLGQQDITVQWGLDWDGAVHFELDDGDGDDMTGPFFAGEYWMVTRYGPGWMHLTGYEDKWDLADYDHCAEDAAPEDC